MIDDDFVKRAQEMMKPVVEEKRQEEKQYRYDWQCNNYRKFRDSQKKYDETDKGQKARDKCNRNRKERMKKASENTSWDEMILIREFYENCPEGYEVDHIMPISKGGLHKLSNLQYLTWEDNKIKHNRLDYDVNNFNN